MDNIDDLIMWPECFANNKSDFSNDNWESLLADQLVSWGNIYMGATPPNNFFEVMNAISIYTGVFTPDACKARCDMLIAQRKNKRNQGDK